MTELKIPSIELPKIKFSTITIPSLDSIPTRTWLIIIFVLVMFLLSCMTTRTVCPERYNREDFEGNPVDLLDAGQGFAPKPSYNLTMHSRCLPGERDIGEWCVKEGCPEGTQRGIGLGEDFCYPKCIMDYESDGGSRCWKKCPEGWSTQGDKCIRPKNSFKKDVIPCKGCLPPPPTQTLSNGAYAESTSYEMTTTYPNIHSHKGSHSAHIHPTKMELNKKTLIVEPFGNSYKSKPDLMVENLDNSRVDATQTNVINKPIKTVWRIEDRIGVDELPCPLGYTLSGDKCYENCPPHYRDGGDGGDDCILDRYAVERPSYDRGSGIPYASKRSKYLKVHPIDRTN